MNVSLGRECQAVVLPPVCARQVGWRGGQVNWDRIIMMMMIKVFVKCLLGAQGTPDLPITAALRDRSCFATLIL